MALADGATRYTSAHAFTPKIPRARTSTPTTSRAAITRALAPPGKLFSFAAGPRLEYCQINRASRNWAARNERPASAIVSDICSSIRWPWVEMSSGATQVCRKIGIAERIAIMTMVIAKNFALMVRPPVKVAAHFTSGQHSGEARDPAAARPSLGDCLYSVRLCLEGEVDILGFIAGDGHIGGLCAIVLVPGG